MQATTRGRILCSGIGGGKSRVLCYSAICDALKGERVAVVSFSYRMLYDVILHSIRECLDAFGLNPITDYQIQLGNMAVVFPGGGEVMLRSGDDPDRLRGLSIDGCYIDECRQFPDRTLFDVMIGRLRESESAHWALTTSPKGKDWVYKVAESFGLQDAWATGFARNDDCTVIVQATYENTFLPESYIADLRRQYTGKLALQEIEGQIVDWSAGIFLREWFDNRDMPYKVTTGVRYWDLASSTEVSADFSVGVLMSRRNGISHVVDVKRVKMSYPELRELIVSTAYEDGEGVVIGIEQVGMQLALVSDLMAEPRLARFKVKGNKVGSTGKLARAMPLTSRFESKTLKICNGKWNDSYVDEMCGFSGDDKAHDDSVDATSGAWTLLNVQPLFRSLPTSQPAIDDAKSMQSIGAIEIVNFRAHMVRGQWNPHTEQLLVLDSIEVDTIAEIVAYMKPCVRRLGGKDLDNDSLKNISMALVKGGAPIVTGDLDPIGSAYWANSLIQRGRVYVAPGKVFADMSAADTQSDPTPWVRCFLRIVQECRSWKKPETKVYAPFEKAREQAKKKYQESLVPRKDWA